MIVLAEHDEARRKELISLIGEMGYAVTAVSEARELVWNLKNTSVKFLILNPELPGFGERVFDFIRKVRSRYSKQELPIMMVSHPEWKGVMSAGMRGGVNDIFPLPLDAEMVRSRIKHQVEMKKEFDDLRFQLARSQEIKNATFPEVNAANFSRTVSFNPAMLRQELSGPPTVAEEKNENQTDPTVDTPVEPIAEDTTVDTLPDSEVEDVTEDNEETTQAEDTGATDDSDTLPELEGEQYDTDVPIIPEEDELMEHPALKETQTIPPDQIENELLNAHATVQLPAMSVPPPAESTGTVNLQVHEKTVLYDHGTDPNLIFRDTDPDKHVPCELPIQLEIGSRSAFCKSIWLARREMLVLTFEDLPPSGSIKVILYDTQGTKVILEGNETSRKPVSDGAEGVLKLHLDLTDVSENYESLFFLLQRTYQQNGVPGLKSAFPGGSSPEEHYARNLGSTMAFSSSELSMNLMKGFRYKYEHRLGRGSFASVFLVRDMVLKREVAMKVLSRSFSQDSPARMNFLSEAQIAAQFHHPNIVFVYEVGEIRKNQYDQHLSFPSEILDDHPDRFIYFTMQNVEGCNLRRWLEQNSNADEEAVVHIWSQVAEALAYAHAKGVVHRDIKPENILITPDNRALVADFGIATLTLDDGEESGENLRTACTPKYASPEQLEGYPLDKRTDIYSLGVIAYEMMAGSAPFEGRSVGELAYKHMHVDPDAIGRNEVLESIIARSLSKQRDNRYASADELLEDLRAYRGQKTEKESGNSLRSKLTDLVELVLNAKTVEESGDALEHVTSFLNLHKTDDDVEAIKEIKQRLVAPNFINRVLEMNLNYDNLQTLIRFFTELSTSRVVAPLLSWFARINDERKMQWLGEMALVSVGRDIMPLVDYGLDLPDHEAAVLLKCFAKRPPKTRETIYLRWSLHSGYRAQMELLKIVKELEGRDTEILNLLNLYANGNGTRHAKVREIATLLLEGRLLLI